MSQMIHLYILSTKLFKIFEKKKDYNYKTKVPQNIIFKVTEVIFQLF